MLSRRPSRPQVLSWPSTRSWPGQCGLWPWPRNGQSPEEGRGGAEEWETGWERLIWPLKQTTTCNFRMLCYIRVILIRIKQLESIDTIYHRNALTGMMTDEVKVIVPALNVKLHSYHFQSTSYDGSPWTNTNSSLPLQARAMPTLTVTCPVWALTLSATAVYSPMSCARHTRTGTTCLS